MSDITHLITMQCSAGERTLNFALDCVLTLPDVLPSWHKEDTQQGFSW